VFRSRPARDAGAEDGAQVEGDGEIVWEVTTGVLNNVVDFVHVERHGDVEETRDGGLSVFIAEQNHRPLPVSPDLVSQHREVKPDAHPKGIAAAQSAHGHSRPQSQKTDNDVLHAYCLCGTVKFHVTRPNTSSLLPHSPFPDLMVPYHTKDPLIPNPGDEKWWLRTPTTTFPMGSKYLAGTCACRSCRLTSGFEVQTWAFVPRSNIYFHIPQRLSLYLQHSAAPYDGGLFEPGDVGGEVIIPLDFDEMRKLEQAGKAILRGYESSEGVAREFCPGCGATVFWHDANRPELIDVSVGLLDAPEGARAEEWLEWWVRRVSFEEEAGREEEGGAEGWGLIQALKSGLGGSGRRGER
jgi:hypothetical protein